MEKSNEMRTGQCSLNLAIKKSLLGAVLDCRWLQTRRQVYKYF